MSMPLTDDELATLRALLAQVKVAKGAKDGVPYLMTFGRLGLNTDWCCNQETKDNAAVSLDSTGNPTFFVIEYGGGALVQGTIPTLFDLRQLCVNPNHTNVLFKLSCLNGRKNVLFRVNGMDVEFPVPPPHALPVAAARINAYAALKLGRALLGGEQQQILTQWPGPTYTDADLDAIELLIDTF